MKNYLNGKLIYYDDIKGVIYLPCPVCGSRPHTIKMAEPWNNYLVKCPECGFSYGALGDYGDNEEEAIETWNRDVIRYDLNTVSVSAEGNEVDSNYWKEKKEWYLQQNKKKDLE